MSQDQSGERRLSFCFFFFQYKSIRVILLQKLNDYDKYYTRLFHTMYILCDLMLSHRVTTTNQINLLT